MLADFYRSDFQSAYALWPVPALFLLYLLARWRQTGGSAEARFVRLYCLVFACETILDSFATGLLSRWLGFAGTGAGTALLVFFVLLGDFRVLLLLQRLARPERPLAGCAGDAALWTLPVPLAALAIDAILPALVGPLPEQTIWLVYELGFLALALFLRVVLLPDWVDDRGRARLAYLQSIVTYVAVYYALWAIADVMILVLGLDLGWGLRAIPNQLYYSFYVPWVYFRFFESALSPASDAARREAQASR